MSNKVIRILIAEDSTVVRRLLTAILDAEPDMEIVGCAGDGREAVRLTAELKPDLITMDIRMPVMDGFEATRMIMSTNPTPIVVISSSVNVEEMRTTFRAIEEGALAVMEKPKAGNGLDFGEHQAEMLATIRAMASVKVIQRTLPKPVVPDVDFFASTLVSTTKAYELVALGSSTGGPQVLQYVLSSLPVGFPAPIVIAQHISEGFIGGLVEWLKGNTLLKAKLVVDGEELQDGTIYFAPEDRHIRVVNRRGRLHASTGDDEKVNRFRPSVSVLFDSVAKACPGRAVGGLLTGMGRDGATGLLAMRQAGCSTFVQDEESSIVFGMPGSALEINAADKIVKQANIAAHLTQLVTM